MTVIPADATDAAGVLSALTATSKDEAIATVAKTADGQFDVTLVAPAADADGKTTIDFASGALTASLAVTVTKPAEG